MVALAPNYRHNALLAEIAVPFASLALLAAAAFAVVAPAVVVVAAVVAAAVAVPVHQQLQSDQIGFVLLTSCQVELAALTAFQQEMMCWKMQRRY
jgi:hypothetical protein